MVAIVYRAFGTVKVVYQLKYVWLEGLRARCTQIDLNLDFGELTFVELIVYFMTKHEKSTRSKWNDKIRENSFVSH